MTDQSIDLTRSGVQAPISRADDWTFDTDSSGTVELDERDGDGNPLQVGDVARSKLLSLTYDDQARLTSSLGTNLRGYQDCDWVYDPVGNRVGETCYDKQVSYEIEPTGNELLFTTYATNATACNDPNETVTQTRTRDVIGRQTHGFKGRFGDAAADYTLDYGADTRLARATVGSATYDYVYNHRMLRWRTSAGGTASGTRDTVYGESGSILHEKKYSGEVHEYVWLGSRALGLLVDSDGPGSAPATLMALGTDHLATPHRAWRTSTGTTAWAGDYEAFGSCTPWLPGGSVATVDVSLRFPGQIEDGETGLHYNWWRYYGARSGSYLQPDPVLSTNSFAYANSSSLRLIDSNGLFPGDISRTPLCSAVIALNWIWPTARNTGWEYGGYVTRVREKAYTHSGAQTSRRRNEVRVGIPVAELSRLAARWHTHQEDDHSQGASLKDVLQAESNPVLKGKPVYIKAISGFYEYVSLGERRLSAVEIGKCQANCE